ncbi:MAG: hypothetical protein R3F14_09675 [Polyangiaceae bacterium]
MRAIESVRAVGSVRAVVGARGGVGARDRVGARGIEGVEDGARMGAASRSQVTGELRALGAGEVGVALPEVDARAGALVGFGDEREAARRGRCR